MSIADDTRAGWADAFIVVYSILSRESFISARFLVQVVSRLRPSAYTPILLLANMTDLEHRRQVTAAEGHQVDLDGASGEKDDMVVGGCRGAAGRWGKWRKR